MTEFNVGDKVRVSNTTRWGSYGINDERFPFEGRITDAAGQPEGYLVGLGDTDIEWSIHEDMMELIEDEPKFNVGDKVRVRNSTSKNHEFIGEVGTVSTSDYALPFEVTVSFEGAKYFFEPSDLELVEDEPEVQVGDTVRVTKVYEFEVISNHGNLVTGEYPVQGNFYHHNDPTHTIEVIEKAKPRFEVGQVLTDIEELEALPVGAVVSREWTESIRPPRAWTKTEAGEFHAPGMDWDRDAKIFGHRLGQKIITVVWLP